MAVALDQLIATSTVTNLVSRVKTPMQRFQDFLGMGIGGVARNPRGGREFFWDIFDKSRKIAQPRAPVSGPSAIAPHPVGQKSAVALRTFEKIPLEEARLFRTRALGQPWGTVDQRGQRYVAQQTRYLGQRASNLREFAISRMLRGQFYIQLDGAEYSVTDNAANPSDNSPNMLVDFDIPATNKGKMDTGSGPILTNWLTSTTNIHGQILAVNRWYEQQHGYPLRHIWMNSTNWDAVLQNDTIKALAGTSNVVFSQYNPTGLRNAEGIEDTGFNAVLRGIPWLTWHIYDAGLDVGGTWTPMIGNNNAIFMPDPSPDLAEWLEGSEIVAENVMDQGSERFGLVAYVTRVIDPAAFELKCLEVGLPALYIPKSISYAQPFGTLSP